MSDNNAPYEVLDSNGQPVPENFLSPEDQLSLDETFKKVLSYGWVGKGIKLYAHSAGRRTAFYTEKFVVDTFYDYSDGMVRSHETGDLLDPLFSVWSKA